MTVRELIKEMSEETFDNEKDYTIDIKDRDGNYYVVSYYDWCDQTIVVEKIV